MKGAPLLVAIRHDDGGISMYDTVRPILRARRLKGSFAVVSSFNGLNTGGYDHIDYAEMRTMKSEGDEFNNHSKTHQQAVLPTDTQANCYTEIMDGRQALIDNGCGDGIAEDIFCPPYGEWGTNYSLAIAQANVKMCVGLIGQGGHVSQGSSNAILDPMGLVPTFYILRTTTTTHVSNVLNTCIAKNAHRNGGFLILCYHHVVETPAAVDIQRSTANYTRDMDNLAAACAAGNAECVTLSELYLRMRP